jgi:hypothetical protein
MMTGVAGQLPLELGNITELISLHFQKSDLSAGSGSVPDSIGLCTKLIKLNLWTCKLKGGLPMGLRDLKSLGISRHFNEIGELVLYENDFTGSIPEWLCDLVLLESLDLERNEFYGTIPDCIGSLILLSYFNLGDNDLTGELPIVICDLVNLEELEIEDTSIEGNITPLILRKYPRVHWGSYILVVS